ncbi:hypothetical protein AYJ57_11725 [Salipiger sp. CCB-MM3]|nr:hypothetical protein AYJ57_11725 [Salipiger sp. CCB-MM3]
MAVWTNRSAVIDGVRTAIDQGKDVVCFQIRRAIGPLEGRIRFTEFAGAICAPLGIGDHPRIADEDCRGSEFLGRGEIACRWRAEQFGLFEDGGGFLGKLASILCRGGQLQFGKPATGDFDNLWRKAFGVVDNYLLIAFSVGCRGDFIKAACLTLHTLLDDVECTVLSYLPWLATEACEAATAALDFLPIDKRVGHPVFHGVFAGEELTKNLGMGGRPLNDWHFSTRSEELSNILADCPSLNHEVNVREREGFEFDVSRLRTAKSDASVGIIVFPKLHELHVNAVWVSERAVPFKPLHGGCSADVV